MTFVDRDLFGGLKSGATFDEKKYSKDIEFFKTAIKNPVSEQLLAPEEEFSLFVPARNLDFFRTGNSISSQNKKISNESKNKKGEGVDLKTDKMEQYTSDSEDSEGEINSKSNDGNGNKSNDVDEEQASEGEDDDEEDVKLLNANTQPKQKDKSNKQTQIRVINNAAQKQQKKLKRQKKNKLNPQQLELYKFLKSKKIHCTRSVSELPPLLKTFEDLCSPHFSFPKNLIKNVQNLTNNSNPTPIQSIAVPLMFESNDLIAQAPTGSGKTAGYILPILNDIFHQKTSIKKNNKLAKTNNNNKNNNNSNTHKKLSNTNFRACVIGPTKELVDQIFREFEKLSINLGEGVSIKTILLKKKFFSSIIKSEGQMKFDILISTPNRLAELVKQDKLNTIHLKYIVLDEADKLFDLGFLTQIDEILHNFGQVKNRCISIWSATIPDAIIQTSQAFLLSPTTISIGAPASAASSIRQNLLFSGKDTETKLTTLRMFLKKEVNVIENEDMFPMMIFVETKERARNMFREIALDPGEPVIAGVMESEMSDKDRERMIRDFRIGKIWILICTDLMARGIDFKGVKGVVNFDLPNSMREYIHRIGRTGRGNCTGWAVSLWCEHDANNGLVRQIGNVIRNSGGAIPDWMKDSVLEKSVLPKMSKGERKQREKNPGKFNENQGKLGGGARWIKKESRQEAKRKREEFQTTKEQQQHQQQQRMNHQEEEEEGGEEKGARKKRRVGN